MSTPRIHPKNIHPGEWVKRNPLRPVKSKYGEPLHWDGLCSLFILLAGRNPKAMTPSEREWFEALTEAFTSEQKAWLEGLKNSD